MRLSFSQQKQPLVCLHCDQKDLAKPLSDYPSLLFNICLKDSPLSSAASCYSLSSPFFTFGVMQFQLSCWYGEIVSDISLFFCCFRHFLLSSHCLSLSLSLSFSLSLSLSLSLSFFLLFLLSLFLFFSMCLCFSLSLSQSFFSIVSHYTSRKVRRLEYKKKELEYSKYHSVQQLLVSVVLFGTAATSLLQNWIEMMP